jgi:hypothetical protein
MTGYICIAMLVDPPYNIILSATEDKPEDWLAKLPLPSHLLCHEYFVDAKGIEQQCLTRLKEQSIDARSYRAFSAMPHEVIRTFMIIRDNSIKEGVDSPETMHQESGKEGMAPKNDVKIENNKNGPFGLKMGMSLEQISNEYELLSHGIYRLLSVPKPHSEFVDYIVRVSPTYGLYWIKAIGRTIATSSHGIDLKVSFERMMEKLKISYGEVSIQDFLLAGSIWSDSNDFMMGLLQKERSLYAVWDKTNLSDKNDLITVFLGAQAVDRNSGYIVLEYSFNNESVAEFDLSQAEDNVL